jgi:outer membrane protein
MKKSFLSLFTVFIASYLPAQSTSKAVLASTEGQMAVSAQTPVEQPPQAAVAPRNANNPSQPTLTLADAEARALQHQPRLMAQRLRAQAANRVVAETRSAYFPQLYGNITAVQANGDSVVAAGAVTTSSISTRAAGGLSLLQMITDFGRTNDLVRSVRFSAQASSQAAESVRQQIVRDVDDAYFGLEAAESVRRTAQAVLDFRRVSLRQLSALAQSQLRSTLDVQFAQVQVSEAELALVRADSTVEAARAQLTEAMGDENDPVYVLTDQALPPTLEDNYTVYVNEALTNRPDLNALKLQARSDQQYAHAEEKLYFPTLNALGSAGEVPTHDSTLRNNYGAIGLNLNIPVFNGGLYTAQANEAKLRYKAADRDVTNLSIEIARDVKTAWAEARDSFLEIQVAQRLVDQTNEAMRLSQARYDAGLGSIVELNQAELNQTSALITAASARFDYQQARTQLDYTVGIVH